jgi:hypothetical protein
VADPADQTAGVLDSYDADCGEGTSIVALEMVANREP